MHNYPIYIYIYLFHLRFENFVKTFNAIVNTLLRTTKPSCFGRAEIRKPGNLGMTAKSERVKLGNKRVRKRAIGEVAINYFFEKIYIFVRKNR